MKFIKKQASFSQIVTFGIHVNESITTFALSQPQKMCFYPHTIFTHTYLTKILHQVRINHDVDYHHVPYVGMSTQMLASLIFIPHTIFTHYPTKKFHMLQSTPTSLVLMININLLHSTAQALQLSFHQTSCIDNKHLVQTISSPTHDNLLQPPHHL